MLDESRVFDVSRPSRFGPSATSKPLIVGHHPIAHDPMVKGEHNFGSENPEPSTKIPITDGSLTIEQAMAAHTSGAGAPAEAKDTDPLAAKGSPAVFSDPADEIDSPSPIIPEANHPESVAKGPFTAAEAESKPSEPPPDLPKAAVHTEPHIEGLRFPQAKRRGRPWKLFLAAALVLLIAAYLAIDSGLVHAGFNLPFHIFKQKWSAPTVPAPAAKQPAAAGPSVPDGFKEYKIAGTALTFAAPIAWGDPTSTTDAGYSKRGAANQPDGIYAYLVNFSTNKDIQIAVTSSKYLPSPRPALYYDYLQWCTGTNDGLIYESVLNFSTANKIDTPTTIACNQGPAAGALKLDSSTIIQAQAKDTAGKVIGDIYTKNLKNDSLVVFRVKDAAMTNGAAVKQLLGTVKIPASNGTTAPSP